MSELETFLDALIESPEAQEKASGPGGGRLGGCLILGPPLTGAELEAEYGGAQPLVPVTFVNHDGTVTEILGTEGLKP